MMTARGLAAVALAALVLLGAGALIARIGTVAPPVDGSTDKAGQRGRPVIVLEGPGKPWVLFATTLDQVQQSPGLWFPVRGARWGTDSPEPEKPPNATLRPDGTVVLDART